MDDRRARPRLRDLAKLLLPVGARKRRLLDRVRESLSPRDYENVRYYARLRWIGFYEEGFGARALPDASWPQLALAVEDERLQRFVARVNERLAGKAKLAAFTRFAGRAASLLPGLIAPGIIGLEVVKEAVALQLFAREPFHVLLLGDPATGKSEVLRSVEELAPHSVFGLGSGTSRAGLTGMYEGREFKPGLLVQADEGFALIDELNLLKKEDRAGLYSAMEKGFITIDKGGRHERHDARVRVLATANPPGDRFTPLKSLREQLPFDEALLSRFHLLFLVRKPGVRELGRITKRIVRGESAGVGDGDARFIREYVGYAEKLNVAFDETHESRIVAFIERLKAREDEFIVEVGPRTVIGIIRVAKAYARSRLSRHTNADDVEQAMRLVRGAMTLT